MEASFDSGSDDESAPKNGRQRLDDFLALLVFGGRPRTNEICKALILTHCF